MYQLELPLQGVQHLLLIWNNRNTAPAGPDHDPRPWLKALSGRLLTRDGWSPAAAAARDTAHSLRIPGALTPDPPRRPNITIRRTAGPVVTSLFGVREAENRYDWAVAAVVMVIAVAAVFGWWWHSTSDQRALRDIVERQHAQCVAQVASAARSTPGQSTASAQRCDLQQAQLLEQLGL